MVYNIHILQTRKTGRVVAAAAAAVVAASFAASVAAAVVSFAASVAAVVAVVEELPHPAKDRAIMEASAIAVTFFVILMFLNPPIQKIILTV